MSHAPHILIIEDDIRLLDLINEYLTQHGFTISTATTGTIGVQKIYQLQPDLVILDMMLPEKDGFSVCREVRANYQGLIMILTAIEDDIDQVAGLEAGADDYVIKPVQPRVLLARIKALLRRQTMVKATPDANSLQFGQLSINTANRSVHLAEAELNLTTAEFDLLHLLAQHAGQVLSRDTLLNETRGIQYDGVDRSIDFKIANLRKKLNDDATNPRHILTVRGQGYLFVAESWT